MPHLLRPLALLLSLSWVGLCAGSTARAAENFPMPSTAVEGAQLVTQYEAKKTFFEGPAWDPKTNKLYFTAFAGPKTQILRLDAPGKVHVFLDDAKGVNGMFLGKDGRLIGAQVYTHKVVSIGIGENGPTDIKDLYHNPKLIQPNDVCQAPNGNIYFTDPDFDQKKRSAVYLLTPQGAAKVVVSDMEITNGVRTSLDGKTLYVSDDGPRNWRAYPIQEDGTVGPGHVFFDPPTANKGEPDGMGLDELGNLYVSGRGGVWAVDPHGKSLGFIPIPEFCSYASFGGTDGKTLFFACQDKIYSLQMKVRGAFVKQKK